MGGHHHNCAGLVLFHPRGNYFNLGCLMIGYYLTSFFQNVSNTQFRLASCWVCQQTWRRRTGLPAKTPSNSTHIGDNLPLQSQKFLRNNFRFEQISLFNQSVLFLRIYGPRLYPYLTTNWRFVWPNPGKR